MSREILGILPLGSGTGVSLAGWMVRFVFGPRPRTIFLEIVIMGHLMLLLRPVI
jgi:hypothetical protein